MRYFEARFDPARERDEAAEAALREEIAGDLDDVVSLDHDRILRNQLGADRRDAAHQRLQARARGDLVQAALGRRARRCRMPSPMFEIYVYSPEMEGIHLRGGPIARGGIRWSDRMDYRTEVYGLMRAQLTKNAIIVPAGAKGGFILKRLPAGRDELQAEVKRQYVTYVRSLLDLTDNLVDGEVVHPPDVRVLDEDDTYLVVAADKGTATMSDTANGIAARVRLLARRRVRLRRLGGLRPQEARDHRPRGVGVGQAPLPRAGHGPGGRRVHRRGHRRHVGRRVRQRDAAQRQAQAAGRLRPPARVHRPEPGPGDVVRGAPAAVSTWPAPRGTTTTGS